MRCLLPSQPPASCPIVDAPSAAQTASSPVVDAPSTAQGASSPVVDAPSTAQLQKPMFLQIYSYHPIFIGTPYQSEDVMDLSYSQNHQNAMVAIRLQLFRRY